MTESSGRVEPSASESETPETSRPSEPGDTSNNTGPPEIRRDRRRGPDRRKSGEDGITIVIPAYNEEGGIRAVLESLFDRMNRLVEDGSAPIGWEIIIVDDGSLDATGAEVEAIRSERQDLRDRLSLVTHQVNRGYGAALKSGIQASRYPWILITDADGTYPDESVGTILSHRDEFQMIVGARIGAVSNIPLIRRPPKWVLRKFASYLARREIPDLNSGLRLMRKDVVQRFLHILPNGFSFTTTISLAMLSEGFRVKYVEIDYLKRTGASKIRPIYDTLNFLQLIIRTIMYFEPLRIFIPLSATFIGASALIGITSYLMLDRMLDSTTVLLFVTGVQLLAIGMLADVINKRLGGR